jgi:hypothetical protein
MSWLLDSINKARSLHNYWLKNYLVSISFVVGTNRTKESIGVRQLEIRVSGKGNTYKYPEISGMSVWYRK